ncbi:MAG: HypC/HybG/HupF family hydrogenase formation chaperone [bacterium]
MCLAIPGKLITESGGSGLQCTGRLDFGGVIREVNLALVPEAKLGDYLLVHAGVALTILSEEEAEITLAELDNLSRAEE